MFQILNGGKVGFGNGGGGVQLVGESYFFEVLYKYFGMGKIVGGSGVFYGEY